MKLFNKVAIIGVGLIGGSLGLALKKKRLSNEVIGIFRRKESLKKALAQKAVDRGYLEIAPVKDADLIIIATPVRTILSYLEKVVKIAKSKAVIIDVGSTKTQIIRKAKKLIRGDLNFVGCHPLAGLEKRGVEYANAGLFENSICFLTPLDKLEPRVELLWKALGAKVKIIDAQTHDRIVAFTSHLPHLLAYSLILSIPSYMLNKCGNSLKDTTRIASSDAALWMDIFLTNKIPTLAALNSFQKSLEDFKRAISNQDGKKLSRLIKKSQNLKGLIG